MTMYPTSGDVTVAGIRWKRAHPYPIWTATFADDLTAEIRNPRGQFWVWLIFWEARIIKESDHDPTRGSAKAVSEVRDELFRMGLLDEQQQSEQVYDFPRMELRRGDA